MLTTTMLGKDQLALLGRDREQLIMPDCAECGAEKSRDLRG